MPPAGSWPLSVKIAAGAVAVGIIGIVAATILITRIVELDFRREFTASRNEIARQIAGNIAGALRFKKAEVIADAYKTLIEDPAKPVAALATTTLAGELVTQYAEPGQDTARLVGLPKTTQEGAEIRIRSVGIGDELVSIAPAGKDKDGNPYGYFVIAWKTDAVRSYIWNVKLSLVATLTITMLAVVAAILFLTSKLMTGPLGLISDRMLGLAKLDTSTPVPCEHRSDEIGVMARAVAHIPRPRDRTHAAGSGAAGSETSGAEAPAAHRGPGGGIPPADRRSAPQCTGDTRRNAGSGWATHAIIR